MPTLTVSFKGLDSDSPRTAENMEKYDAAVEAFTAFAKGITNATTKRAEWLFALDVDHWNKEELRTLLELAKAEGLTGERNVLFGS